jgi:hypothetical protein
MLIVGSDFVFLNKAVVNQVDWDIFERVWLLVVELLVIINHDVVELEIIVGVPFLVQGLETLQY